MVIEIGARNGEYGLTLMKDGFTGYYFGFDERKEVIQEYSNGRYNNKRFKLFYDLEIFKSYIMAVLKEEKINDITLVINNIYYFDELLFKNIKSLVDVSSNIIIKGFVVEEFDLVNYLLNKKIRNFILTSYTALGSIRLLKKIKKEGYTVVPFVNGFQISYVRVKND